jgi:predicted transcriptional regulator of viral defense system
MAESIGIKVARGPRGRSIRARWMRVVELAARQSGVVSRGQLTDCGADGSTIRRWIAQGRLHRIHPGVYAVGYPAVGLRGRVTAGLLYAGPGAALSHQTAAWAWELINAEPRRIHASTGRDRSSIDEVCVHRVAALEVVCHRGFPVTGVPRTLLDLAATMSLNDVQRALAEADHLGVLFPDQVARQLGRGRAGSARLRRALSTHLPELAEAASELERRFLLLCERAGIAMPEVNVFIAGLKVDCLWRAQRVVVELDGHETHDRPAAAERDRHRDLTLRAAGFVVLRYTWQQVVREPDAVVADLVAALGR